MRKIFLVCALLTSLAISKADIISFDLSPPGTDNAVGLSWANEVPAVTNSSGTGGVIGSGILFDTSTLTLSLSVGYGSAFGFTDLTGPATAMHIHGPAPTNVAAPVLISLATNHTYATNPAAGGSIGGTVTYTADQVPFLLSGSNYINIHTATNASGEIRGQLVAVNTFPTLTCPPASTNECDGSGGKTVMINAQVGDADGDALTVVWTVDGAAVLTNTVPAGAPPTSTTVSLVAFLTLGQHLVVVAVADSKGGTASCSTTATVVDTTPPVITSASASPNVLWPPNHKMVNVALSVTATDICSSVTISIKDVTSNEAITAPKNSKGKANKSPDWKITGPLTLQLRSERAGKGNGRNYTIVVEAKDTSGNTSTANVIVRVPHDQRDHSASGNSSGNANGNGNGNGNASDQGSNSQGGSSGNGRGHNGKGHGKS